MSLLWKIERIFRLFCSAGTASASAGPATSTTAGATSTGSSSTPRDAAMPLNPKPLLDLIARHESESSAPSQGVSSGYDVVVHQAFKIYPPNKPITSMTVDEVLGWQAEAIRRHKTKFLSRQGYSAVGRYQIIRSTLQNLLDPDWKMSDLFDAETQDLLAMQLLRRRGWSKWASSDSVDADNSFADALSREWASLPYHNGKSYYAGDEHGNASLVSRDEVLRVLRDIRNG